MSDCDAYRHVQHCKATSVGKHNRGLGAHQGNTARTHIASGLEPQCKPLGAHTQAACPRHCSGTVPELLSHRHRREGAGVRIKRHGKRSLPSTVTRLQAAPRARRTALGATGPRAGRGNRTRGRPEAPAPECQEGKPSSPPSSTLPQGHTTYKGLSTSQGPTHLPGGVPLRGRSRPHSARRTCHRAGPHYGHQQQAWLPRRPRPPCRTEAAGAEERQGSARPGDPARITTDGDTDGDIASSNPPGNNADQAQEAPASRNQKRPTAHTTPHQTPDLNETKQCTTSLFKRQYSRPPTSPTPATRPVKPAPSISLPLPTQCLYPREPLPPPKPGHISQIGTILRQLPLPMARDPSPSSQPPTQLHNCKH
ncbi:leucine-rich repeat extensin-like protein 5 [Penaeus monodon]|uniref:leucine-rich repeat extensin-like protein 5 n=1 Tax=Penaeus monodon TaxID=6687 RepID=UPI0018A7CC18|nr:leucine-rich repeat extensin-like protein 5 [Penaeus monodon]